MALIRFEPLTQQTIKTYIQVGTQSYNEHYLHLWEGNDPTPYLVTSFTHEVATYELNHENSLNFLVQLENTNVGILKISPHHEWGKWSSTDALYLHRIYLLRSATGKGVGKAVLDFTESMAKKLKKKVIWLETMKKGKAVHFYKKNGFKIVGESNVTLKGVLDEEKGMWVVAKEL